jgi:hypothetical protein
VKIRKEGLLMEILNGFEKFTKQGKSFNPKISIRMRGQIGFNAGAVNRFKLEEFGYVVMFYSKEQNKIAFKFTKNIGEEGVIKIVPKKGNFYYSGKTFLDYYGIPYDKTRPYDVEWDEENKVAIIDLGRKDKSDAV